MSKSLWEDSDIWQLAALMTGDIDKDHNTLSHYLKQPTFTIPNMKSLDPEIQDIICKNFNKLIEEDK
jgi:hypothetical protein